MVYYIPSYMTLCLFSSEETRTSRKLENDLKHSNYLNPSLRKAIYLRQILKSGIT